MAQVLSSLIKIALPEKLTPKDLRRAQNKRTSLAAARGINARPCFGQTVRGLNAESVLMKEQCLRDGETTIKMKFAVSRGGGLGGREENRPKKLVFVGNATTTKIWKCKFYCREILLSLRSVPVSAISKKAYAETICRKKASESRKRKWATHFSTSSASQYQAPPSYGSGRYGFEVFGAAGFRSARQVLCGDASRLFPDRFSKHLSSVLGRTELCREVRNPGPQRPQIIRNENHHLALLDSVVNQLSPHFHFLFVVIGSLSGVFSKGDKLGGPLSRDLLSNLVRCPLQRYTPKTPEQNAIPPSCRGLCCDRAILEGKKRGYSSDSLRYPGKQSATGLLHLSRDRWAILKHYFPLPSAFLKYAFREVTCGFCKHTVPGAPPQPLPRPPKDAQK